MQTVKAQLSATDLSHIADLFQVSATELVELDGYESYVLDAGESILKLNPATTKNDLLAELAFINHLAAGGLSVARALPSKNNQLVERYELPASTLLITQFEKASGKSPGAENASDTLFQQMGQLLGKLHSRAKSYSPAPQQKRNEWLGDSHVKNWRDNVAASDPVRPVVEKAYTLLTSLVTDRDSYGLVHADYHSDNLLLDGDTLTLIDFADCLYGWFAMDIATALFYYKRFLKDGHNASSAEQQAFAKRFYEFFMRGYQQENTLSAEQLRLIPTFYRWRYIDLYIYLRELEQTSDLDEDEQAALEKFGAIIQNDEASVFDRLKIAYLS